MIIHGKSKISLGFLVVLIENFPYRLCDCQLLWVSTVLMPVINKTTPYLIDEIKCAQPQSMVDRRVFDLGSSKKMEECLAGFDLHQQKRNSFLVMTLLVGVLLGMMVSASVIFYKMNCGRRSRGGFSRAHYTTTDTQDDDNL